MARAAGFLLPLFALALAQPADGQPGRVGRNLPRLVLWAWERGEDLRFIDPETTAVAYLAGTFFVSARGVVARPRRQPLVCPAGTERIAVVRLESRGAPDSFATPGAIAALAAGMASLAGEQPGCRLQIDFDARVSERAFYRELLTRVRAALPRRARLSITALASWCRGDPWIAGLPVDEAVPMLFRMGRDGAAVRGFLAAGGAFDPAVCRGCLGISLDEPRPRLTGIERLYVFNPRPWTAADYFALRAEGHP